MKSTATLMMSQATRLAAFALALTVVLGIPVTAKSVDSRNDNASNSAVNRSAPARPAAKPSAPARTNTARPTQAAARAAAARPAASRPAAANRPATANRTAAARPAAAQHANTARPAERTNTAHAGNSRPAERRPEAGRDAHGAVAHNGGPAGHGDAHGGGQFRNASYNHGGGNLHGGGHIPDDRFRSRFGHDHQFHIGHPTMIGGQASFQFGGFWFGFADPWPAAWLYTDPVYVDYVDGGYVLVNVAHPGVEVALSAGDAVTNCTTDTSAPDAPVAAVAPAPAVTVAYVAPVPVYSYLTWHYWGPRWHHYWR